MTSAVKVILGVSVLAMAAGFAACDNGGTPTPPLAVAGTSNSSAGTGTTPQGGSSTAAGGTGGGGVALPGIPLEPKDGWVPDTNEAKIQGALFSFGDDVSKMGKTEDFTGTKACIKGNAAKVDTSSDVCKNKTFTPPAMDCYGQYWGIAIGLNLNQSIDPATMMGAKEAPYDASNLQGFGFDIEGDIIPGGTDFRFKVEDGTKEYCTPKSVKVKKGFQIIKFSDLMAECWQTTDPPNATVTPAVQSHLIKISWQVVTNTGGVVPFDFCVSDIRAIPKDGSTGAPPGSSSGGASLVALRLVALRLVALRLAALAARPLVAPRLAARPLVAPRLAARLPAGRPRAGRARAAAAPKRVQAAPAAELFSLGSRPLI